MRYEFLTEYPCKYFLWPPIWVKAIRTAGSTAEGRSYRHYWFLIMESTAFCCWVKNSILWVALFSCVGCASTCKSVNKSSKSKYLLYRLWRRTHFLLGIFCARGKSGRKQIKWVYLQAVCHQRHAACIFVMIQLHTSIPLHFIPLRLLAKSISSQKCSLMQASHF